VDDSNWGDGVSRLFIAINLPDSVVDELQRMRPRETPGIRPTSVDQIHLTLHFLGEQMPAPIADALGEIDFPAFKINLCGVGQFASREQGPVLWVAVEESPELTELHGQLATVIKSLGIPVEKRTYTPHLTLARCKPFAPRRVIDHFLEANLNFEITQIPVDAFTLYSSQPQKMGHLYQPLRSYPLLP